VMLWCLSWVAYLVGPAPVFLTMCYFAVQLSRLLFVGFVGVVCLCFGWFV
jgi:hypothetical protein